MGQKILKRKKTTTAAKELPEELVRREILTRLPIKSAVQSSALVQLLQLLPLLLVLPSLPCGHPLPDPDMYIDNIDWNAEIDPGLIADMEKENRYPDEAENSTDNKISDWNKCGDVKDNGVTSDEALKDKKLNEPNSNCPTNQNNDIEKIDSGMHFRACRKREEYQENTKRRKSQKQGADPESQQFLGKGRRQTRYNLRPRKLVEYTMSGTVIILKEG
ncbi:hypothetical protein POM88_051092 [Heracleum sosnowskyi]|uniref:Uncharacterized protein n=1 Tax=Heracleum sosnowskyi TaxID=360622 RepID=A0AAD8H1H5_9APIA|nr:hypothetical protein POM88_051092 [Heracleum sosnowskyi]